jgi:hypothetical protein
LRGFLALCVLAGLLIIGWFVWRGSSQRPPANATAVTVDKQPVAFAKREFSPSAPPAEMPPLSPGETAVCDSDYLSSAIVDGETQPSDATHATLTITKVKIMLQLKINIWLPIDAPQHLVEHEEGHREISEYYYQTADQLAERIAATYVGRRVEVTGSDLGAESSKMLQQMAHEITQEYSKELNPDPTQLLYDDITDHSRNGVVAKDAVDHAIKNAPIEAAGEK